MIDRSELFKIPQMAKNIDTSIIKTKDTLPEEEKFKAFGVQKTLKQTEFYGLPLKKMDP